MHKAGKLINGVQPGIPESHGGMQLAWLRREGRARAKLTAYGEFGGRRGIGDAATVLECNAGGVPWPQIIAFYSPGPALLGWAYLTAFHLRGERAEENTFVRQLTYRGGGIDIEWSTQENGDPAAVSSLDYSAILRLSDHRIVASNLVGTTEQQTARRFLDYLRHGNHHEANRLAAPIAAVEAVSELRMFPSAFAAVPKCYGLNDIFEMPAQLAYLIDTGGSHQVDPKTDRLCALSAGGSSVRWIALGMRHVGFRTWQVTWARTAGYG